MTIVESIPVTFECLGATLFGILESPEGQHEIGVIVVVGGPQYRVGSHRQFVLLSRFLAKNGIPSFRFDHRGVGDSDGATTFEDMDSDIKAAIDELVRLRPDISAVVLWGLCDAASAIAMYAPKDPRVAGLVMLNPWVRSESSLAKAYLKEKSLRDLFDRQRWSDLLNGRKSIKTMLTSVLSLFRSAYGSKGNNRSAGDSDPIEGQPADFRERMLDGVLAFDKPILLILSGQDITAKEFESLILEDGRWKVRFSDKTVTVREMPDATHTFSTESRRKQVERTTQQWIRNLPVPNG